MRTIGFCLVVSTLSTSCTMGPETTAPNSGGRTPGPARSSVVLNPSCGDVIVTDLRLESDLTCSGDGLMVTGTDLKINLNGHTITGAAVGQGIRVTASQGVSIYGGSIRGFLRGIFVVGSTGLVIKDNEFAGNNTAIILEGSSGNTI